MKTCKDFQRNFTAYLENGLGGAEAVEMWDHLESCPDCRTAFKEEQAFVSLLHDHLKTPPAPPHLELKIRSLLKTEQTRRMSVIRILPWAAVFAALLLLIGWMSYASRSTDLAWAVEAHRAVIQRRAALDIETGDPVVLARWFSDKADPVFSLSNAVSPGLELRGGRVVQQADGRIAQVVYKTDQGESSLFVLPQGKIRLRGGSLAFGGLRFYPVKKGGYHLLAWSGPRVSYVLVAKTAVGADRGCLLCHGSGMAELPLSEFYDLRARLNSL